MRVSGALQAAAKELGANSAAREVVAWLGQLQQTASREKSESIALRTSASEVALHIGHDQDVGEVDLLNGVVHRDLLLACRRCHGVDLGPHLADHEDVKPHAVANLHRVPGVGVGDLGQLGSVWDAVLGVAAVNDHDAIAGHEADLARHVALIETPLAVHELGTAKRRAAPRVGSARGIPAVGSAEGHRANSETASVLATEKKKPKR